MASKPQVTANFPTHAIVHPIVLLSVVDHFHRFKDANKRVVGVLLGSMERGVVDITNCYASMNSIKISIHQQKLQILTVIPKK